MAIPMVLGKKIILIGDHKQLPPMVDDDEVKEAIRKIGRGDLVEKLENIKESQFKRLFEASQKMRQSLVSTLDTQYRMHKQIMNCITHFYKDDIDGGLKCGIEDSMDSEDWSNRGSRYHGLENSPFINPNVHAIWVDVDGKEEKNGHSPYNRAELKAIEKILKNLRASDGFKEYMSHCNRPEDEEIGIITFYGAQVKELQKMHKEGKFGPGKYKIDVVDSFQGMERNIVIISTVRTDKIGFAKAIERINVAFSRAKRLLIVVGDKDFFAKNPDYRTSIQAMEVIGINQLS
jgi:superfamily I DNA and/or RNA helicase